MTISCVFRMTFASVFASNICMDAYFITSFHIELENSILELPILSLELHYKDFLKKFSEFFVLNFLEF
jgi:hypothetical protein